MRDYRLGLYEKAMPAQATFRQKLACVRECGFDWLEISVDETDEKLSRLDWTAAERKDLTEQIRESGVPVATMCLSGHRRFPIGSENDAVRARGMEILEKAVLLAADIGVRIIQLAGYDTFYDPSTEKTRALFSENLERCVNFAARYGVILAFETMETPFINTVEKAMAHVRRVGSPFLQVYPDAGNITNSAFGNSDAVSRDLLLGRGHIPAVHLKESAPGVYRDLVAGQGYVDFPRVIEDAYGMGVRMFTAELWCKDNEWKQNIEKTGRYFSGLIEEAAGKRARPQAER